MSDLLQREGAGTGPAPAVRARAQLAVSECLRLVASARRRPVLAWLIGAGPLPRDARLWYRSAVSELQVAAQLRSLGAGWTVLCDDDQDAGRLIIGPTGVFTVDTRDHAGQRVQVTSTQMLVNGRRTNHFANARHQAAAVSRILSSGADGPIDVTPVIAVVDPGSLSFQAPRPTDVLVAASSQLVRLLVRRRRADLPTAELVDRALDAGWRRETAVVDELTAERFGALRASIFAARARSIAWLLGIAAVVGVLIWSSLGR